MALPKNLGLKILAFVSAGSLFIMAAFCLLIVFLMYACAKAADEGLTEGSKQADESIKQLEKSQQQIQRKLEQFRPFDDLPRSEHSPRKNYY